MTLIGANDVNAALTPNDFTVLANFANASADFHRRQLYRFMVRWEKVPVYGLIGRADKGQPTKNGKVGKANRFALEIVTLAKLTVE